MAAAVIEHAGSPEQCQAWLPALASGETIGALGSAVDGVAELVIGGADAQTIVLIDEDGNGLALSADEVDVTPLQSIDPTRSAARIVAPDGAGDALGDACVGSAGR